MGKGLPRDSMAMWELPNIPWRSFGSPHFPKDNEDRKGCTENPPSCFTGQSHCLENPSWKPVEFFFCLFFLVFIVSGFFAIKAHLEAANALQLCEGWALNTSQKVLLGVPPWELVALTPPWTQRHPGEQQPQPGLGGVVGFKYLQRKRGKKDKGKKFQAANKINLPFQAKTERK